MIRRVLLLLLGCWAVPLDADPSFEKLRLQAGEAADITAGSDERLILSHKQIIEVQDKGKGQFRILAMRAGLVHVKAEDSDGRIQRSWLVEVFPRDPEAQWLGRERWKNYFCREALIVCDEEQSLISGESDDLVWLHEAKEQCRKKPPCQWEVRLSAKGRELWLEKLRAFAPEERLTISPEGALILAARCDENKTHAELRKTFDEAFGLPLQLICQVPGSESWYLDVLAIALRKGYSDLSNPLQWKFSDLPSDAPLKAAIEGLSSADQVKILAQPEILLSAGSSISLADGMEMQTALPQRDANELLWKPLGFRLDLTLLDIREDRARVRVALRLSRARASLRSVDASELKTEAWIPVRTLFLVGKIEASMENQDEARIPWIGDIPWIGELFSWRTEGQVKSDVQLFLRLRSDLKNPAIEADANERGDSP